MCALFCDFPHLLTGRRFQRDGIAYTVTAIDASDGVASLVADTPATPVSLPLDHLVLAELVAAAHRAGTAEGSPWSAS